VGFEWKIARNPYNAERTRNETIPTLPLLLVQQAIMVFLRLAPLIAFRWPHADPQVFDRDPPHDHQSNLGSFVLGNNPAGSDRSSNMPFVARPW
jgi:hypothetical protein